MMTYVLSLFSCQKLLDMNLYLPSDSWGRWTICVMRFKGDMKMSNSDEKFLWILIMWTNSSIHMANNKGCKTEPWGTPHERAAVSDMYGSISTDQLCDPLKSRNTKTDCSPASDGHKPWNEREALYYFWDWTGHWQCYWWTQIELLACVNWLKQVWPSHL